MSQSESGFTLVELMIAVAIIGILASVAVPTFKSYVLKTKQSEVNIMLPELARRLQVFYDTEHCPTGLGGKAEWAEEGENDVCVSRCITHWANSPNVPGPDPQVVDWYSCPNGGCNHGVFHMIDFMPSDPLYFSYHILSTTMAIGSGGVGEKLARTCDVEDGQGYALGAISDLDGDGRFGHRFFGMVVADGQLVRSPGVFDRFAHFTDNEEF